MNNHSDLTGFIWSIANLLRDDFRRSKYQDVILPFTVLRRLDQVLIPTKEKVLSTHKELKGKLDNLDPQLRRASGFAFYNTSEYTFERLLGDAPNLADNLSLYINSFSENIREVFEKFDMHNTITKLDEAGLLFMVMEEFKKIDLSPDTVSNLRMGTIFEELIRKFNEALNENPGEHFTPREVIRLMVNLMLGNDEVTLSENHLVRTVYDPCCGSGGMLTIAKDRISEINPLAEIYLYGQEVNPETYAVAKSDLYIKSQDGKDADRIKYGSTLSNDGHADQTFDYLLANPPYGKDWNKDQTAVEKEAKLARGRFASNRLPRKNDGQLLFLQHMIGRMKSVEHGGSRIAIVMNGSPLFTGDAASGESETRRWILENDWLEAVIALPQQLFYNTGISTYIWVLTNRKEENRRGKVQLIDASEIWIPMPKSLGDKRRKFSDEQIEQITKIFHGFEETEISQIFDTQDFGFRKITVERPLRLNFQASPERIERLDDETTFKNLAKSKKKKDKKAKAEEEALGRQQQKALKEFLATLPDTLYRDRAEFDKVLDQAIKRAGPLDTLPKFNASMKKAILSALSEPDETAEICLDKKGNPEPDTSLRDTENVPLKEDIWEYFEREVLPHVPDAWVSESYIDEQDRQVGRVGYEINFNRYFYKYEPPRPLHEIEEDIKLLEKEIIEMLGEVTK